MLKTDFAWAGNPVSQTSIDFVQFPEKFYQHRYVQPPWTWIGNYIILKGSDLLSQKFAWHIHLHFSDAVTVQI